MSHPIILRAEAESEFRQAFQWYEDRFPGLGTSFVVAVDACLQAIGRNPQAYQKKHKNIRGGPVRRFPFVIYYLFDRETVVVLAVFHASRDPQIWHERTET